MASFTCFIVILAAFCLGYTKSQVSPNLTNTDKTEKQKLLPGQVFCGLQHTDDYIYNATETSIDEFPWLVVVNCFRPKINFNEEYVGVVISKRYVLTYCTCDSDIMSVRLGQHHREKIISCVETEYADDCTDPRYELKVVEKFIFEPGFQQIQLLRMERNIFFSDYVRPICLPFKEDENPKINETVVTSGWEQWHIKGGTSDLKKRSSHSVISFEHCGPIIFSKARPINNPKFPMCTGLISKNNDYCKSDMGGPITFKYKQNWFLIALYVGGVCVDRYNSLAERLAPPVLDWILENIHA